MIKRIVFNNKSGTNNLNIIPTLKDDDLVLDIYGDSNTSLPIKSGESAYITLTDEPVADSQSETTVPVAEKATPEVVVGELVSE